MKSKHKVLLLLTLPWLLCQCNVSHEENESGSDYPSQETFAVIDSCMSFVNSEPQKSHHMLDSLKDAGLMTEARCDYFHAMVMFTGVQDSDSALAICNRLLDEGKFGDDLYLEEEICVLASNITSGFKRHLETLRYASRGIAICHGNEKMRGDEATLMGRVGAAEHALGRTQQARETYARAYELLEENTSFADLVALISLKKREARLCIDTRDYDREIGICKEMLDMVERFDRDPSFIKQRPETMQKSCGATHDFANFYRIQIYSMLARSHRLKVELGLSENAGADTDSVKMYVEKWSNIEGAQSLEALSCIMPELYFTGRKQQFHESKELVEEFFRGDSLVSEYVDYLALAAKEAADNRDLATSNAYLRRALVVSDSIRQQEMMRTLAEQMSLNMVQEHQLARQDAEYELARQKFLIALMATLLLLLIGGIVIAKLISKVKKSRELLMTTRQDLNDSKEDMKELVHQLEETKSENRIANMNDLYERIECVMKERYLYLNPELDIKMLAEASNSSRSVVSSCINSVSGKSFRQWLAEYRLTLFTEMLKESPDASLDELMLRCGYKDQSTFRRQFKTTYGMTASEYRKYISDDKK